MSSQISLRFSAAFANSLDTTRISSFRLRTLNLWGYKLGKTCSACAVQRTHAILKHKSTQLHLRLLRLNVRDIITNWKICVAGSYLIYRGNCKGAHLPSVLEAFWGEWGVWSGSLSPGFTALIRSRVLRTVHMGSVTWGWLSDSAC